jgi:hypothetical protein
MLAAFATPIPAGVNLRKIRMPAHGIEELRVGAAPLGFFRDPHRCSGQVGLSASTHLEVNDLEMSARIETRRAARSTQPQVILA